MSEAIKEQMEQMEGRNLAAAAQYQAQYDFAPKLSGWDFYKSIGSPKYIVAPMVDHSELAWRILSRRYKADLCYTPMFNARLFVENQFYRDKQWAGLKEGLGGGGPNDRPLIAQFCANDPEYLLQAALMVAPYCDAVDINLGCPQHIARRGHYGSYLMEDWPLISSLISTLHRHLPIPVTAKIRVFPEVEKTIAYANMVVDSGAQILVVHGRLREMKGHLTGIADWEKIRLVQESVGKRVPVIANGNILYHGDLVRCLEQTGCAGVMTAEGNLYNPAIFTPDHLEAWKLAEEYLKICDEVETKLSYIRGHLFKIFRPSLLIYTDLRNELGIAQSKEEMWKCTQKLKERLIQDAEASKLKGEDFETQVDDQGFPILPHWLLQPYFRQSKPDQTKQLQQQREAGADSIAGEATGSEGILTAKRTVDDSVSIAESNGDLTDAIAPVRSNKRVKKIKVQPNMCYGHSCTSTFSPKCVHHRCKHCCRTHMRENNHFDCDSHLTKNLKEQREKYEEGVKADSQKLVSEAGSQVTVKDVVLGGMVSVV
ncbi:hypothetical protein EDD11_008153 [Mortierella claussenii]|nr:hypothetical protein EDD11_008153 [Mortierella claussenii]